MKLPKTQCNSCPFLDDGLELSPAYMAEIYTYLARGYNHLCHSDSTNNNVCLGGRQWQLDYLYKKGWIMQPTNWALEQAMNKAGVVPKQNINN